MPRRDTNAFGLLLSAKVQSWQTKGNRYSIAIIDPPHSFVVDCSLDIVVFKRLKLVHHCLSLAEFIHAIVSIQVLEELDRLNFCDQQFRRLVSVESYMIHTNSQKADTCNHWKLTH